MVESRCTEKKFHYGVVRGKDSTPAGVYRWVFGAKSGIWVGIREGGYNGEQSREGLGMVSMVLIGFLTAFCVCA